MDNSVEALCNLLAKHKLLDTTAVRNLRQRWVSEAGGDAGNCNRFGKWLVAQGQVTEFQLNLLNKGSAEQLLFDQYILQDRIGQGRMAGVYRAIHPTGQQVAIKVLPPSKNNNPQLLARFQREARMAVRLQHANVVRTYQQGKTRSGLHYIVMELLEGESLDEVLKRRKAIAPVEAVQVGVQALEGLQHLFEEGLIHRDLKPGNLMLVPGWKPGRQDSTLSSVVKIMDIGLGRAMFDEGVAGVPDQVDLTAEGSILGTTNYMAPEQARSAHTADIRADIYSMGCVLYEALAGRPPFDDPNFMNQILRHATEPARPLRELNPVVPAELWQVIEIMLAKDPAQRHGTPRQAARALRASIPAPVEPPKAEEPSPKMRSYLTWLALNTPATEAQPEAAPPKAISMPPVAPAAKAPPPPAAPQVASPVPAARAPAPPATLPVNSAAPVARVPAPANVPASSSEPAPPPATPVAVPLPPVMPLSDPRVGAPVPTAAAPGKVSAPAGPAVPGLTPPLPGRPEPPRSQPAPPNAIPVSKKPPSSERNQAPPPPPPVRTDARLPGTTPLLQWKNLQVTVRDLICAGIGVGVVLILECILWLILSLFAG
jgi:serine/threonine protein kinase